MLLLFILIAITVQLEDKIHLGELGVYFEEELRNVSQAKLVHMSLVDGMSDSPCLMNSSSWLFTSNTQEIISADNYTFDPNTVSQQESLVAICAIDEGVMLFTDYMTMYLMTFTPSAHDEGMLPSSSNTINRNFTFLEPVWKAQLGDGTQVPGIPQLLYQSLYGIVIMIQSTTALIIPVQALRMNNNETSIHMVSDWQNGYAIVTGTLLLNAIGVKGLEVWRFDGSDKFLVLKNQLSSVFFYGSSIGVDIVDVNAVQMDDSTYLIFVLCGINGLSVWELDIQEWKFKHKYSQSIEGAALMDIYDNSLFIVTASYRVYSILEYWVDFTTIELTLISTRVSYGQVIDIQAGKDFLLIYRVGAVEVQQYGINTQQQQTEYLNIPSISGIILPNKTNVTRPTSQWSLNNYLIITNGFDIILSRYIKQAPNVQCYSNNGI